MFLDNNEPPLGSYGVYALDTNILHSSGARVMVHAPNTLPIPVDHGQDVAPGFSTSVSIKPILHARLPNPYGNCSDTRLRGLPRFTSTFSTCIAVCKQELIIRTCGCRSSALPEPPHAQRVPYCGQVVNWRVMLRDKHALNRSQHLETLACEDITMERLKNDRGYETDCGCTHPCVELSYHMSTSMSYWPLELYQYDALTHLYGPHISTSPLGRAYMLHKQNIEEGEWIRNQTKLQQQQQEQEQRDQQRQQTQQKSPHPQPIQQPQQQKRHHHHKQHHHQKHHQGPTPPPYAERSRSKEGGGGGGEAGLRAPGYDPGSWSTASVDVTDLPNLTFSAESDRDQTLTSPSAPEDEVKVFPLYMDALQNNSLGNVTWAALNNNTAGLAAEQHTQGNQFTHKPMAHSQGKKSGGDAGSGAAGPGVKEDPPYWTLDYNRQQMDRLREASTEIRQNLVRVNVYLEDLSVVKYKQMPAYGLEDLFADIGGTLGLWMGVSVLTIMELLELVVRLTHLFFRAEWRPGHQPQGEGADKDTPANNSQQQQQHPRPHRCGSVKEEERLSYEPAKDQDRMNYMCATDQDRMNYMCATDQDRIRYESARDQEKMRHESVRDQERLMFQTVRDHDRMRYESLKDQERMRYESVKDQERMRYEPIRAHDGYSNGDHVYQSGYSYTDYSYTDPPCKRHSDLNGVGGMAPKGKRKHNGMTKVWHFKRPKSKS